MPVKKQVHLGRPELAIAQGPAPNASLPLLKSNPCDTAFLAMAFAFGDDGGVGAACLVEVGPIYVTKSR